MAEFIRGFTCGCKIVLSIGEVREDYDIEYCPKHDAAPKMYEALKEIQFLAKNGFIPDDKWGTRYAKVDEALAKANSKTLSQ